MKKLLLLFIIGFSHCFGQSADRGDLLYTFEPSSLNSIARLMSTNEGIRDFRQYFNQTFALPRNIPVRFCDCGEENAYYSPQTMSVTICYEYVQNGAFRMKKLDAYSEPDIIAAITMFVLGHELGHALIHQYDLPITGKEEDSADQFSVLLMLRNEKFYSPAMIGTTHWLLSSLNPEYQGQLRTNSKRYFADVHGLNEARYYNYLALVCGYNPETAFQYGLISDTQRFRLPVARGEQAGYEYKRAKRSWDRLLSNYYKSNESRTATLAKPATVMPSVGGTRIEQLSKQVQVEISPRDWHVLYFPSNVYPTASGQTTYRVKLDGEKNITSIRRLQSSLSDTDELVVKKALARFMFDKDKPVSSSTELTVTLIFDK